MTKAEHTGIERAIQDLLTVSCIIGVGWLTSFCEGPDHPVQMRTCSKCWVIVGLRNLLKGLPYDHE